MSVKRIVQYPDPVLRQVCEPYKKGEPSIAIMNFLLRDTMAFTNGIIGLAACQIGIPKRAFQFFDIVAFNPEIVDVLSDKKRMYPEGCASFKTNKIKNFDIERDLEIKVKFYTPDWKETVLDLKGMPAIVFQHELDHINGKLYIDYAPDEIKENAEKQMESVRERYVKETQVDESILSQCQDRFSDFNRKTYEIFGATISPDDFHWKIGENGSPEIKMVNTVLPSTSDGSSRNIILIKNILSKTEEYKALNYCILNSKDVWEEEKLKEKLIDLIMQKAIQGNHKSLVNKENVKEFLETTKQKTFDAEEYLTGIISNEISRIP